MGALENLRSKYPQYDNIDDNTLIEKVVTKYPQYKDVLKPSEDSEQSNSNSQNGFTVGVPNMPQAVSNIPSVVESQRVANRESASIPAEFVNEVGLGLPKYAVNKIAGEGSFPEAESTAGKVFQNIAGAAGALTAPVKVAQKAGALALGQKKGALRQIGKGIIEGSAMGALITPEDAQKTGEGFLSTEGIKERGKQALEFGSVGGALPAIASTTGKVIQAPMKFSRWFSDRLMDTSLGMKKADRTKFLRDNYAGEDAAQWANDRGIFGNQEQIIDKLKDIKKQSYDALNNSIDGIKGTFKHGTTQRVLNKLRDQFNRKTSVSEKDSILADKVEGLYQKSLKEGLTLSETLKVKRLMDDIISPFKPSGESKAGIEWQDLSNARNEIKIFIEDTASKGGVKNVKDLSKDIQLSSLMSKAMEDGNVTGKTNRILSLTDWILTAGLRDPISSFLGVGAKKIAEMPSVKTKVASFLRNLSGDELKQFEVMKMNGSTPKDGKAYESYKKVASYLKKIGETIEKKGADFYNNNQLPEITVSVSDKFKQEKASAHLNNSENQSVRPVTIKEYLEKHKAEKKQNEPFKTVFQRMVTAKKRRMTIKEKLEQSRQLK